MSGTNGATPPAPLPGGIHPDPTPVPKRGFTLDEGLARLRERAPQERPNGAREHPRDTRGADRPAPEHAEQDPPRRQDGQVRPDPAREQEPGEHAPERDPERDPERGGGDDDLLPGEAELWGEDQKPGDPPEEEPRYAVTVEGERRDVPVSELVKGYMRGNDYTKKTQVLAQTQQEFADAFAGFTAARTEMEKRLDNYLASSGGEFDQPVDWEALAKENIYEHAAKMARWVKHQEATTEKAKLSALREREDMTRRHEVARIGHEALSRAIPGWKDDTQRQRIQAAMRGHAQSIGFTEAELTAPILDPRLLIMLHESMMFRRFQSRKVQPATTTAPPAVQRQGTPPATPQTRRQAEAARAFHEGRPSVENALALLAANEAARNRGRGRN